MNDLISRQAAIDTLDSGAELLRRVLDITDIVGAEREKYKWGLELIESCISDVKELPSAEPEPITVNIDHELTQEEYVKLCKDMASAPIVLLPSTQPEKCTDKRTETHPADREDKANEPKILDATCGDRTIWFQKNEPHTTYCDIRREEWEGDFGKQLNLNGKKKHRHLVINPDIQCSFTDLPFDDGTFNLVVFDPPHITNLAESSWTRKAYGSLDGDWKPMIHDGFNECMRVLSAGGVLIFKWSDISVSTRDIIKVIGKEPLFGHRSGKKMNTHWMCFMKFDDYPNCGARMEGKE